MIIVKFRPIDLKNFFTNKTRELCKYCKRYGQKTTCPPHIDNVEYYKELLPTYNNGELVVMEFPVDIENWESLGKNSSLKLHMLLLEMREVLFKQGRFAVIYGAGSCKNCNTCQIPCAFPEKSIIPIEATGLMVVNLVKKIADIDITFPVENQEKFYRIGMILYD